MSEYIYWEKQSFTLLCGVHALNSLLQGPWFSKEILDKISKDLDKEEKELFQSFNQSENFDETGFYSIQVMSKALLSQNFDISHYTVKQFEHWDEQYESAFLLHFGLHWIAIRKINSYWFVLDSLRPHGPLALSENDIKLNIRETLQNQNYCWFVIHGEFKKYNFNRYKLQTEQFLIPIKNILQQDHVHSHSPIRSRLIIISNQHGQFGAFGQIGGQAWQEQYMMMNHWNDASGISQEEILNIARLRNQNHFFSESKIMKKSNHKAKREHLNDIKIHEKQEIKENNESNLNFDEEYINIRLCLPNLEFISRRFKPSNTLNDILVWANRESSCKNLKLFFDYPKRVFNDLNSKIKDVGISSKRNVIYSEI